MKYSLFFFILISLALSVILTGCNEEIKPITRIYQLSYVEQTVGNIEVLQITQTQNYTFIKPVNSGLLYFTNISGFTLNIDILLLPYINLKMDESLSFISSLCQ